LAYPNFTKPFKIHTDVSKTQLGSCISQNGGGGAVPLVVVTDGAEVVTHVDMLVVVVVVVVMVVVVFGIDDWCDRHRELQRRHALMPLYSSFSSLVQRVIPYQTEDVGAFCCRYVFGLLFLEIRTK
jgi:hypothetical protein